MLGDCHHVLLTEIVVEQGLALLGGLLQCVVFGQESYLVGLAGLVVLEHSLVF